MIYRPVILFISWCIIACNSSDSFTKEERQAVTDTVRATLHRYYDDIKQNGLIAEFAYLDSSAEFSWHPPGYGGFIQYDSVAKVIRQNAGAIRMADNSWDSLTITPITKQLASYSGGIRSVVTDTAGNTDVYILTEKGQVIKRADGWKLLNGTTKLVIH
jgi:hypothetical protein